MNKKLLIVNYDFYPAGGAGIKRCVKFMKFLPDCGWDCIVLTVKKGNHALIDESRLHEVQPCSRIYRAFTFETVFKKNKYLKNEGNRNVSINNSMRVTLANVLNKIYEYFGQLLKVPDSRILWMPAALNAAVRISRREKFDAIYATGPTFVNLILGGIIKKFTGKPLISDFRDAWISDPMLVSNKKYLRTINACLEKFVVLNSDRIISTNPFVTHDFKRRFSSCRNSKFYTIYNGYDIDDYNFLEDADKHCRRRPDKLTIVYTGRLYGERTPKYFLEALRIAIEEKPQMRACMQVIFVGSHERHFDGKTIEDYIEDNKLNDVIKLTGYIHRRESLRYQMDAHVLLLLIGIVPESKGLTYGLSGKVFDYILSGKPILTLANGGATREFIMHNKIGEVFCHEDFVGIKNYLCRAFEKWKEGTAEAGNNMQRFKNFDFRLLTKELSEHLNKTTGVHFTA
jgi:glycosyltransferase involved in cell wall biosynthesis